MLENKILWDLSETKKKQTKLWQFADSTKQFHGSNPDDYNSLHTWSIKSPNEFYSTLWDFLQIIGDKSNISYIASTDIREAQFYPGAFLNYAENLLQNPDNRLAVIAHLDDGTRRVITRKALYDQVSRMVQALKAEGIKEGDCVAAIVTNDIEAIIGYLSTAAIGAIWSSCSPDFGPTAASDRLCQVDPKILLSISAYSYAGKHFNIAETIKTVADGCKLKKIILIDEIEKQADPLIHYPYTSFENWLKPFQPEKIIFNRLPYDAPLVIMFSSGTTGQPKCIVHSAMGLLIQHKKELLLHCDLKKEERFFYFSTCGWMMWNWQVSGLSAEATLVTYDGNPFHSEPKRLLDLIDKEKISVFGTSAKYIDACQNFGLKPKSTHQLKKLRLILSTGSPLMPASFDYLYEEWKKDFQLASISGGTDICACFLGGSSLLPVYKGELQCSLLGIDIDIINDYGEPISNAPGELICRNAHLSMPLSFYGDKDGSRYHEAYFSRFQGVWTHGDFAEKCPSGGFIIHGRSDTTLNPGGVRIGTAEIYRQVETIDEVEESIAIGQNWEDGQRVILFVKLQNGINLDNLLMTKIKNKIRQGATPHHLPAKIISVRDIPRTRSGKISETAVRDTIHGKILKNISALANPESLDLYKNITTLQS